jgi:hypothetical protein
MAPSDNHQMIAVADAAALAKAAAEDIRLVDEAALPENFRGR